MGAREKSDEARAQWATEMIGHLRAMSVLVGDMAKSLSFMQDPAERNVFHEDALRGNAERFEKGAKAFLVRVKGKRRAVKEIADQNGSRRVQGHT